MHVTVSHDLVRGPRLQQIFPLSFRFFISTMRLQGAVNQQRNVGLPSADFKILRAVTRRQSVRAQAISPPRERISDMNLDAIK